MGRHSTMVRTPRQLWGLCGIVWLFIWVLSFHSELGLSEEDNTYLRSNRGRSDGRGSGSRVRYRSDLSMKLWREIVDKGTLPNINITLNDQGSVGGSREILKKHSVHYTPDFLMALKVMNTSTENGDHERQIWTKGRKLNVFGDRPRNEVNETVYPFSAVGILSTRCTGTMIASNLILTAWHCINPTNMIFFAGFDEGTYVAVALIQNYRVDPLMDWALLETTSKIGDITGWFDVEFRNLNYFSQKRQLSMISYSGDHCASYGGKSTSCRALLSHSCGSIKVQGNMFLHDCSMTRGSSGSAMVSAASLSLTSSTQRPVIVGYNFGEFRESEQSMVLPAFVVQYANAGRPSVNFKAAYEAYINEHDTESNPFCAPLCPPSFLDDFVCDQVCNFPACNFDSGRCECSPGCPARHINDGKCDPLCNNERCGFDGVDCLPTPSPVTRSPVTSAPSTSPTIDMDCAPGCRAEYINDTLCDITCNVPECGFDGQDCDECAPGCLKSWIRDGYCDDECQVESCDFDAEDCAPTRSPISSSVFCAPGCTVAMVGDGICQNACHVAPACRFDEFDCSLLTSPPPASQQTPAPTTSPSNDPLCAPGCPREFIDNSRCDLACLVSACNFDGKDCIATLKPTVPTRRPTTGKPTKLPTRKPTRKPTKAPTRRPTRKPTTRKQSKKKKKKNGRLLLEQV